MEISEASALRSIEEAGFGTWRPSPELASGLDSSLRLRVPTGNLNQVSSDLTLLDREIRRAALFIETRSPEVSLRKTDHEQLQVVETGPGSLWIDVIASAGVVRDVLLSDPVQLMAVTDWLVQRVRPRRRRFADLQMPPDSDRLSPPNVVPAVSELAERNPNRRIRAEITTEGVIIELGPERRWWSSGD